MRKVLVLLLTLLLMVPLGSHAEAADLDTDEVSKNHKNYQEVMSLLKEEMVELKEIQGVYDDVDAQGVGTANVVYRDVPKSHRFYNEIMFLLEAGVIEPGTRFGVDDKVTREAAAVMVAKAVGLDGKKTQTKFKDVAESRSSSGYINSAVNAGIISGYPDGTFRPSGKVTRGHMAAFITRAFHLTQQADVSFKDVPKGSAAYGSVKQMIYSNITAGYPDGTFRPHETLTKAQIAAFIARAMNPDFRPIPVKSIIRGVNFNMNISQVQKAESAVLLRKVTGGNLEGLTYQTNQFGYNNHLTYFFEYGRLTMIVFDFMPHQDSYNTPYEMEYLYRLLLEESVKEFGSNYSYNDKYPTLGALWNKGSYSIGLIVDDDDYYTSAGIVIMPN